ncbi:MAG: hypothetical protein JJE10_05580 [Thermoleophilia bacterium]|nr:hypothetical protein [Thermoleophilia bacterium]
MLILVGIFSVIAGLAAAFDDDYISQGTSGEVFLASFQAIGIFWIVIGVIKVWAGAALIQGHEWARVVAIVLILLHTISDFLTLSARPALSLIFIAIDLVILYAVTVRWKEASIGMGN